MSELEVFQPIILILLLKICVLSTNLSQNVVVINLNLHSIIQLKMTKSWIISMSSLNYSYLSFV